VLALAESSGLFAGGDGQFIGRGLGLIGSTFGAIANVIIVVFFAVFMAAQPRPTSKGFLFWCRAGTAARARGAPTRSGRCCAAGWWAVAALRMRSAAHRRWSDAAGRAVRHRARPAGGLMEFVPYIGPFVAAVPAILVGFADSPQLALKIALLFLFIQSLESYVLAPLIQHKAVYLPPAVILFAQVLMGVIVGALGVAVATPLAAAVMVAVSMLYVETRSATRTPRSKPSRRRSSPSGGTTRRSRRASRRGIRSAAR
jgi:predicted PurR-regulated permease PerM